MKTGFGKVAAKSILIWAGVFLFRLFPFRPPNFEPMLAILMPVSKRASVSGSFLFGFLGIVLYDAVTSGWGSWTAAAAICYGVLGIAARAFFRTRAASVYNFLLFGIPATILYDAATMLVGPVFHGQPFSLAIAGQVPFTLMHLIGTITFAMLLAPIAEAWLARESAPVPAARLSESAA